jgi:UDP-N-acetylmuramoyl-L-alanyl-D-glutamate--2,6-diaminopimelate ligase
MALPEGGYAVLNARDSAAELLTEVIPAAVETVTYGVPSRGAAWMRADVSAHAVEPTLTGTRIFLDQSARFPDLPSELGIRAVGEIFAENALAALVAALVSGVPMRAACAALASVAPPAGRFQVVHEEPYVVVDYAHTPDALERTLRTARALCAGRLSVVFGAGGGRDRAKRPLLGAAASAADRVWLTSDNPRDEDPLAIIAEVASGLAEPGQVRREVDRALAIEGALREAGPRDWILIAGKGHEKEQHTGDLRIAFSDEAIVRAVCGSDTHNP